MKTLAVIPARYASTRFPGKPLALLGGKPVIEWVRSGVEHANVFDEVIVATDDERIYNAVSNFGGKAMMTSADLQSGTDRCGEVVNRLKAAGREFDVVVNVQGDEPFVEADQLKALIATFNSAETDIATLKTPIHSGAELMSPNNVKVVCSDNGDALYFSRAPLPYQRDIAPELWIDRHTYFKHVGIYAYRGEVLPKLCQLPVGGLEQCERLEQLRWLQAGYRIKVCLTGHTNIGIDTPDDLRAAEESLKNKPNMISDETK